jgi:hypothetical protein
VGVSGLSDRLRLVNDLTRRLSPLSIGNIYWSLGKRAGGRKGKPGALKSEFWFKAKTVFINSYCDILHRANNRLGLKSLSHLYSLRLLFIYIKIY